MSGIVTGKIGRDTLAKFPDTKAGDVSHTAWISSLFAGNETMDYYGVLGWRLGPGLDEGR